ncbi:hypothetical protein CRM22_002993 [Opisthorchis felineus]|uniref:Uncharacterized protein n=1 Tax=Opisthorchis felineus TaxID=147828 RepID=A0A4S2M815_OPIFE|nr:hypothetical protein CRM22_002993 [Opisthorchis felineus]
MWLFRSANKPQMYLNACTTEPIKHRSNCSRSAFSAMQMDLSIMNPTIGMHEFRCRFPSSFLALITSYLGYLCFSPEDTKKIQNALIKESKALRTSAKSTVQQSCFNSSLDLSFTTQICTLSGKEHCAGEFVPDFW